jgi:putative Ca2+/H+ antiporter (TMEM165/GDT1 family)
MMAYHNTDTSFLPLDQHERPPTRLEWVVAGFAVLVAVVMILSVIAGDFVPAWLNRLRLWPIAFLELAVAWTVWLRANANRPEDSYSPRSLKLLALTLSLIAITTLAVTTNLFQGA